MRFVVWGGRPGDVWIGSRQDLVISRARVRYVREAEAMKRAVEVMSVAMGKAMLSMEGLGKACIAAAEAFRRLAPSIAKLEGSSAKRVQGQ